MDGRAIIAAAGLERIKIPATRRAAGHLKASGPLVEHHSEVRRREPGILLPCPAAARKVKNRDDVGKGLPGLGVSHTQAIAHERNRARADVEHVDRWQVFAIGELDIIAFENRIDGAAQLGFEVPVKTVYTAVP